MTKQVRIENADTSVHKLMVQVWDEGGIFDGKEQPDVLVEQFPLDNPCEIIEKCIHSTRYLIIKEVE